MDDPSKIYPIVNHADVNGSASFLCRSKGAGSWYFDSKYHPRSSILKYTNVFNLEKLTSEMAGYYFCYGLYKEKTAKHFLARALMKVYGE